MTSVGAYSLEESSNPLALITIDAGSLRATGDSTEMSDSLQASKIAYPVHFYRAFRTVLFLPPGYLCQLHWQVNNTAPINKCVQGGRRLKTLEVKSNFIH